MSTTVIHEFVFCDTMLVVWQYESRYEVVMVKFDSGNGDVRPGIDPIESTQNHTQASKLQKFPKKSNPGPL